MDLLNCNDYENLAKTNLKKDFYDYIASGSGNETALNRNITALKKILIFPKILQHLHNVDTSFNFLQKKYQLPFMIAPMALHKLAHSDGEKATISASNEIGISMILSTMSSVAIENIGPLANDNLFFQLYIFNDRSITEDLVMRAESSGCKALFLTVDTPIMGKRERDLRNKFSIPKHIELANIIKYFNNKNKCKSVKLKNFTDNLFAKDISWQDIKWLRSITNLPIFLKGILHPEDAKLALDNGVNGIVISNHGGRQLDSVPATITALPLVSKAIEKSIPILFDGGLRSGEDIFKALALGADGVLIGRPVMWALNVAGAAGITNLLRILESELTGTMALCGCSDLKDIHDFGTDRLLIESRYAFRY